MKPVEYRHSCTVGKDIPYSVVDGVSKEAQPGAGTLHTGRVVWLDHDLETFAGKVMVRAYVDGLGLIRVDPASLSAVC